MTRTSIPDVELNVVAAYGRGAKTSGIAETQALTEGGVRAILLHHTYRHHPQLPRRTQGGLMAKVGPTISVEVDGGAPVDGCQFEIWANLNDRLEWELVVPAFVDVATVRTRVGVRVTGLPTGPALGRGYVASWSTNADGSRETKIQSETPLVQEGSAGSHMTDLVAWLRAQLDDDERVARAATPGPWETYVAAHDVVVQNARRDRLIYETSLDDQREQQQAADGVFVAANSPDRILAEVAAKRAILAEYDAARVNLDRHPTDLAGKGWLLATVRARRLLAAPYADRPGYRQEWRS
jgi:hypothetical protein